MTSYWRTLKAWQTPLTLRLAQAGLHLHGGAPLHTPSQRTALQPFFIIGAGRSGTTLLRRILAAHPDLAIPPESQGKIPNLVKKFYRYRGLDWPDLVNVSLGEFAAFPTFHFWQLDLEPVRTSLLSLPQAERSLAAIVDGIYGGFLQQNAPQATRWGDKSPFNTLRLKWIERLFPKAVYLHMLRDGRDVVSSYVKAGLFDTAQAAAWRWRHSVQAARAHQRRVEDARFLVVRYEELVQRPTEIAAQVGQLLDVTITPEMIDAPADHLGDTALAHMANVHKPVTTASLGKWRKGLSSAQQAAVRPILEKPLVQAGYLEGWG